MVSDERNLPTEWNIAAGKNVKWVAAIGSRTFGNPVIAGGKVFIGTNNDPPRNPKIEGDKGVLMCFAESDGRFLWQAVHDKLPSGDASDWPEIGICSTPCVVGNRVYYISNRGELVCLDAEGFRDNKNDGPVTDERFYEQTDADFIWTLDMVKELGVVPHHASASPPLVVDDLVYVVTGNGIDVDHEKVPAPNAPSFVAVDRTTGKVGWSNNSPGDKIIDGQWSGAAYGIVNGKPQVVFPGGDGWLYAFERRTGRLIWKFDCNAPEDGAPTTDPDKKNNLLATPVFHDNKVFIAVGQDPESGAGPGCLWAIDAARTGDVTTTAAVWRYHGGDFGRSLSTVAVCGDLLYAAELQGYLHCVDTATGRRLWRYDLKAPVWSSPLAADGKVYIANEDGDVFVFEQGRAEKLLARNTMKETTYGTVTAANRTLYIADRTHLYAIAPAEHVTTRPAIPLATRDARVAAASRSYDLSEPSPSAPASRLAPSAAASQPASAWPMFRGNSQLTGVAGSPLPEDPQLRWRFRTGDAIESSAAIVNGVVYVGSNDGLLYAVGLVDGKEKWSYKAASAIKSSPCVFGDRVCFGDDGGVFHAVGMSTGKAAWTFKTDAEIISSPNCVGGRMLFGSYDGYLYCLDAGSGSLIWKFLTEGRVHGTPGVSGDNVLVAGCDEHLRIVRLADGSEVGSVAMGSFSGASAAIQGSCVFVGTFGNQVLAIDWSRREILWTYQDPEREFPYYSSAAVTGDLVVIGGRDKLVHALDIKTGKARWAFETKDRIDASPVIVGQRVFVGSLDGNLYALDLAGGRRHWQFDTGSPILASPAVGEGCMVVGTEDGTIYCFGTRTPQETRIP
jgi:outer membrane protein assembly factor BamB